MIQKGRLTSGNAPVHVRRKNLTNAMRDGAQTIRTMLTNWPAEWEIPADHDLHELLRITDVLCEELEKPNANDQ